MKTIKKLEIRVRRVALAEMVAEERMIYSKFVHSPEDATDIFRSILDGEDQEVFVALYMDINNKVLGYTEIARGTMDSCTVDIRVLFRPAILQGATSIIVGHNHPSGYIVPSDEDILLTKRLEEASNILGIAVLDHVIVGDGKHYSFAEEGLLG